MSDQQTAKRQKIEPNENHRREYSLKIDFHTHILPRDLPDFKEKFKYGDGWVMFDHDQTKVDKKGNCRMMKNGEFFREIEPNCWDVEARLKDMDKDGIDVQVVCTVPVMFSYWAKPEHTHTVSMDLNNDMAAQVAKYPRRFIGLGTVAMNDPNLAAIELRRCVNELKFPGVQIGSHIGEWNLDNPKIDPFWVEAEKIGAVVFIHPWDMAFGGRHAKHWLPWLVGMPYETCHAVVCCLLGGVLERFPKLKLCFAHGAGSFPFTIGRIDHGYNCRPDLCATSSKQPASYYLGKFHTDSIVHDDSALRLLVDKIGKDKIVMGSDYPFPLGEVTGSAEGVYPGVHVDEADFLTEAEKNSICATNALELLGLKEEDYCRQEK